MKTLFSVIILALSFQAFSAQNCPNIDGVFFADENGSFWSLEQKDNTLYSSMLDTLNSPIILDGQQHDHPRGGTYVTECSANTLSVKIRSEKDGKTFSYDFVARKLSPNKVKVTEDFNVNGQKDHWKYTLKRLED